MNFKYRRIIYALISCVILILLWIIVVWSTKSSFQHDGTITFSADSGFYSDDIVLEMSTASGEIYYTLDSTEPNEDSYLYSGPITISDVSDNANVYSSNTDVWYGFREDLKEYISEPLEPYEIPEKPVDKATVLRAVSIDEYGNKGKEYIKVYFVGYDKKPGYDNMNIVSIVTAPDNLFDRKDGIYVLGNVFNNHLETLNDLSEFDYSKANYSQRGKDWKRKANISIWDKDRNMATDKCKISVQGGGSRISLPKSINVNFDTKSTIYSELGMAYDLDGINLFGGIGDRTKMLDCMINSMSSDLECATRSYSPCQLFLNGEYWGMYYITERYRAPYFSNRYGVDGSNVISVKNGIIELGKEKDLDSYSKLIDDSVRKDLSEDENYQEVLNHIDIESCLDYYALEIYIENTDWPNNNYAMWRTKNISEGDAYFDAKWRWIFYDANSGMMLDNPQNDMIEYAAGKDEFFCSMMCNEEFRSSLEERLVHLANNTFSPDRVDEFIDEYEDTMRCPMAKDYQRYYGDNLDEEDFINGCERVRSFFRERHDYIIETYGDEE